MGICGDKVSGSSSSPDSSSRFILYSGNNSTRQDGRQSPSRQATIRLGLYRLINFEVISKYPLMAFTCKPLGETNVSGIPKNARYHNDALSRSINVILQRLNKQLRLDQFYSMLDQ